MPGSWVERPRGGRGRAGIWPIWMIVPLGLAAAAAPASAAGSATADAVPAPSAGAVLTPLVGAAGEPPPAPWAFMGLPDQKAPPTRFELAEVDGQRALRVEAAQSYGNLVHPLAGVEAGVLSWRWRVDRPLAAAADLRSRQGDDAALKVCALFELPRSQVPFLERQLLRMAELRMHAPLPNATLCYVWAPDWPHGSLLTNAYTRRLRFITLGHAPLAWEDEQHDLAADFLRAFGDESPRVPRLSAVAVGADADNTAGHSLGWVTRLRLAPPRRP